MKNLLPLLLLCLLLPRGALSEPQVQVPTLHMPGLTDLLAKNRGKVLVLNFFATWCPPCRAEIPDLVKAGRAYADRNVQVIGLSVDENAKPVMPFVSRMGVDYPVYMAGSDVAQAYRVSSIPHNVFYDKNGNLVFSEAGVADDEMLKSVIEELLEQK
ncbi:MAG: TlpA family protein disulfide reductase [Desulfovibrio sp.]|jgi:thiol-disulfide isomerase/thioredoxin|nr:TlpA family protein disulfide reductase [Desulfovibrio sp.]